jgi:hypothetical protein
MTDLEEVKQDGQDGKALVYVKEQTPELCREGVKQDGRALQFVREQTPEICAEAVKQNKDAEKYVRRNK